MLGLKRMRRGYGSGQWPERPALMRMPCGRMDKLMRDFEAALRRHERGAIIAIEAPEGSAAINASSIRILLAAGMDGVYIDFRRTTKDAAAHLKKCGAGPARLVLISAIGECAGETPPGCIQMPPGESTGELVRAVQSALSALNSPKKFIFVDSLAQLADSASLAETMKFSEFLTRLVGKRDVEYVILAFEASSARKKFIKDTAIRVDEVIAPR